jgi:hypothetical protein
MSYSRLALGLLLASPLPSLAQIPDEAPAPAPRFYVGLAAYHSNFQNLGSWRQGDTGFRVPVQLTAGYQLRPRLALELSGAYSGRTTSYSYDRTLIDEFGTPYSRYQYSSTSTGRTASVSALARYTLTRSPSHRLQVDVLGGLTLVHTNYRSNSTQTNDLSGTLRTEHFADHGTANNLLLTAGLGLRYLLTPRFALNFDLTTNRNLDYPVTYGNFTSGFTGSAALGVRYRFGK